MMGLTPQLLELKAFIAAHIDTHGVPPSQAELGAAFGIAKSGINRMLDEMEERGHIRRILRKARALEVIDHKTCLHCGHQIASKACRIAAENSTITYSSTPPPQPSLGARSVESAGTKGSLHQRGG